MKAKAWFVVGLLLAAVLTGCLGGGGVKKGDLQGAIVDDQGLAVEAEVTIRIANLTSDFKSDSYEFKGIDVGTYHLLAVAEGYESYDELVTIEEDTVSEHDIVLERKLVFSIEEARVWGSTISKFPTGTDDSGSCQNVAYDYYLAKYQVTYGLWEEVYAWATDGERGSSKYVFAHPGTKGNDGAGDKSDRHPVTMIDWCDAIVWCNALTEYFNALNDRNLECVYQAGSEPLRDATDPACQEGAPVAGAKGFRLPSSMEWELAARYRGDNGTNTVAGYKNPHFTKGNSASGATAFYGNAQATEKVACFGWTSTSEVGKKEGNTLGIYDMSGNVWEWCFDRPEDYVGAERVMRGSSWSGYDSHLQIGHAGSNDGALDQIGFRVARTR